MHEPPTILLVDNDEDDFRCVADALRAIVSSPPRVAWACSAADAVAYLEGRDGYADRKFFPLPDLVLVAVKPPAEAKLDFVRWLRTQGEFRALPVLALSPGGDEFDAARAVEAGVSALYHQPCEAERLSVLLAGIVAHWREGGAGRFSAWPGAVVLAAQSCAA